MYTNQSNNIINACINFLQNLDYNNQIIQIIVIIMMFILLLRVISMFQFSINLNRCTDTGNSILWLIIYGIIILLFFYSDSMDYQNIEHRSKE